MNKIYVKVLNTLFIPPALLLLSSCSSNFIRVEPGEGRMCDAVTIVNDGGHRCGTYEVTFGGVPSTNARVAPSPSDDVLAVVPLGARSGPVLISQNAGTCAFLGAFSVRNVNVGNFRVIGGTPVRPDIARFSASRLRISRGESVDLSWNVTGDFDSLTLNTSSVLGTTGTTVSPTSTTSYRLVAANGCSSDSASLEICLRIDQPAPNITNVTSAFPGAAFSVTGRNFSFSGCDGMLRSSLIFNQGDLTQTVIDATPSMIRLNGNLPASLQPGIATVVAEVGSVRSGPFTFAIRGRENGAFRAGELIRSGSASCNKGSNVRTLTISGSGVTRNVTFRNNGSIVWTDNFTGSVTQTGAGLMPGCSGGYIISANTAVANRYRLSARNFDSGSNFNDPSLGQSVNALFSPDDTVMVYKAEDLFRGVGFAIVSIYDHRRNRPASSVPGPGIACTSCNSISANLINFRDVEIDFDASRLGVFRVE